MNAGDADKSDELVEDAESGDKPVVPSPSHDKNTTQTAEEPHNTDVASEAPLPSVREANEVDELAVKKSPSAANTAAATQASPTAKESIAGKDADAEHEDDAEFLKAGSPSQAKDSSPASDPEV